VKREAADGESYAAVVNRAFAVFYGKVVLVTPLVDFSPCGGV